MTRSKPQVVSDKGSSSSHILSPKPKSRTSLTNEDVLRDLQTKEEEKISHVDSGKGSKSPLSTEVSNTSHQSLATEVHKIDTDASETSSTTSSSDTDVGPAEYDEDEMTNNIEKQRRKVAGSVGDIYTKVAMPRSRSFMNVVGTSSSQKRHYNLQELFKELKEKEGIQSIDDILRHVVNPDGMSFNQMSPVYKELLLKLVMSMSKDELFIRSKNIMDQEKLKSGKQDSGLKSNIEALLQQQQQTSAPPPTVTKSVGLGSLLGFKKPFLMRKQKSNSTTNTNNTSNGNNNNTSSSSENATKNSNSSNNAKAKKSSVGLSVGNKANFTSTGSVSSRRKNSSKRRRAKLSTSHNAENVDNVKVDQPPPAAVPAAPAKSGKKKISKLDIGQPVPVSFTSCRAHF